MSADVRLNEECGYFGVNAGGKEDSRCFTCLGLQNLRVLRNGDGMQVNDTKDALIVSLCRYPMLNGTEIIPNMNVTGWLDARKHALFHN